MHDWPALHKGRLNESIFTYAMRSIPAEVKPFWFKGFREATVDEDLNGHDGYAEIDLGLVPIQIKSSVAGAYTYLYEYPKFDGVVVIIHDGVHEMDIRLETFNALRQWRAEKFCEMLTTMPKWHRTWMPLFNFSLQSRPT